jgi:hypothetical protein
MPSLEPVFAAVMSRETLNFLVVLGGMENGPTNGSRQGSMNEKANEKGVKKRKATAPSSGTHGERVER